MVIGRGGGSNLKCRDPDCSRLLFSAKLVRRLIPGATALLEEQADSATRGILSLAHRWELVIARFSEKALRRI